MARKLKNRKTCKVFCKFQGKVRFRSISQELYDKLFYEAQRRGINLAGLISRAWKKYGVSEKAIKKYLSE